MHGSLSRHAEPGLPSVRSLPRFPIPTTDSAATYNPLRLSSKVVQERESGQAPDHERMQLGGPLFGALAHVIGYAVAGRLLRLRNAPYSRIRTVDDAELARLAGS